ncbi:alpha/beta-hydrolase [Atractiella rhizophila]|nr:alpha/beta-hydrolase [Atractiella rhizophila]
MSYGTIEQVRAIHGPLAYKINAAKPDRINKEYGPWRREVKDAQTAVEGTWIARPGTAETERKGDDIVFYFIHGGGFVCDTGGPAQTFFLELVKYMNEVKGVKFSVFQVQYVLAPEHPFPSAPFEALEGYRYLLKLGIDPSRICISGDSAGGNAAISALMMRSRPYIDAEKGLNIGEHMEDVPKPGSSILISPYLGFTRDSPSRVENEKYDFVDAHCLIAASLAYVGHPVSPHSSAISFLFASRKTNLSAFLSSSPYDKSTRAILANPYVDPSMVPETDLDWIKDAMPERVMVLWGEKECLRDDIERWIGMAESAGVKVIGLKKPGAAHDWCLYDWVLPNAHIVSPDGPFNDPYWAIKNMANFLVEGMNGKKADIDTKL